MTRFLVLTSLLLARPLLAAPAALDFDTARGGREVGMGGAFRELGIGANGADGNPAAIALFQAFQLEFAGGYDWKAKGWYAAGWARDSTQELAGAYSLHYISNDYGAGNVGQWAHSLSLATKVGDKVAFGIGGRWLIQSTPKINAASLNLGMSIQVIPQLTLGFAAYNLIDTRHPELSRSFEIGFGLLLGPVRGQSAASASSAVSPSRRNRVSASRPSRGRATHRPGRVRSRARRRVQVPATGSPGAVTARYCFRAAPVRKLAASAEVACRDLPKTITPVVSRSSRCTSPASRPRCAEARSSRLVTPPGVGCAGRPAGLSTASTWSSSWRMRSGAGAGSAAVELCPASSSTTSSSVPAATTSAGSRCRRPRR